MNQFHNIIVQQSANEYRLWTPQGICIAHIVMPADGQYMIDGKALDYICKSLGFRWGLIEPPKKRI